MKIAYIGVSIALSADRQGVELAPDCFRQIGAVSMMNNIAGCYDLGNVFSSIIEEDRYAAGLKTKYLDTVVDTATLLCSKVYSVIQQGYFPLVVGGEHSLGIGSVEGLRLLLKI